MNIRFISILLLIFSFSGCTADHVDEVCFKDHCFTVEIMRTPEELAQGMQFREGIADSAGMLFVFESEGNYSFWMKNTLIPLDMLWIDQEGEVVQIQANAQPCKIEQCPVFRSEAAARYVLEIRGGLAEEVGIKVGDMLSFLIEENG